MKNLLKVFAVAVAVVLAACSKDAVEAPAVTADEAQVTFTTTIPGATEGRAIADGSTVDKLYYAVYEHGQTTKLIDGTETISGKTATVNVTLVSGMKYDIVFWAQKEGAPYTFNTTNNCIDINWTNLVGNNEARDAFIFVRKALEVNGSIQETITLKRPFAQLNIGISDFEAAKAAGFELAETKVSVDSYNQINFFGGEAYSKADGTGDYGMPAGTETPVTFACAAPLTDPATITIKGTTYKYVSMNYILPAMPTDAYDVDITFCTANEVKQYSVPTFAAVTFERNHRTNIMGSLLTDPGKFVIEIDEEFDDEDYIIPWKTVALAPAAPAQVAAALTEALADPEVGQIILPEMPAGQEIELTSTLTFGAAGRAATANPGRNLIIDGNGATITFKGANRMVDVTNEAAGANLTLKNLTLKNGASWMERGVNYNTNGKLVLDNVKIINAENCSNNYAINLPGSSDGAQVVINNSEIWAGANALNIWGEATVANITNSKFYVVDKNPVEGYAVISLNNDGAGNAAHNSIINIEGGEVKVVYEGEGETNPSSAIRDASNGSVINISESTVVVGEIKIPVVNVVYEGYNEFYSCPTLQAAIDKVQQDNNGTVRLIKNLAIAETVTIKKGGNVAIDLNGYTVSGVNNTGQGHLFMVENGATLTIKDQSQAQTGKITYAQGTSNTGWTIDLEGTLNLESGTLELTGDSWSIGYAVDVRPNSWGYEYQEATTFNMSGGKIVSSDGAIRVASSSADNHAKVSANFNMTGGEIEAEYDGIFIQQSNTAYDVLNVNISNGTLKSNFYPIRLYGPVATSKIGNSSLKISGGTFSKVNVEGKTALVEDFIYIAGGVSAETLYHTQIAITGGSFVDGSALPNYTMAAKEPTAE